MTERKRFPALDPEPAPASIARRVTVGAVWLAGAGCIAAAGLVIASAASGGTHRTSLGRGLVAGEVAILTPTRQLAVTSPGQAKMVVFPALGYQQYYPDPTSDGRYLVTGNGTVIGLSGDGMSLVHSAVSLDLSTDQPVAGDALADHDHDMVVLSQVATGTYTSTTHALLKDLSSGRSTDLGPADVAAGDPAALGVFASVPATGLPPASTSVSASEPDIRIELRDAGKPAVLLGTAAALTKSVGLPAGQPVSLEAMPDAAGDRIAISVAPIAGTGTEGVVVVDRAGRVLGVVRAGSGLPAGFGVSWSPTADALAFPVMTADGVGMATWSLGGALTIRSSGVNAGLPAQCQWSPDGGTILCVVLEAGNQPVWAVAGARGGPVTVVPAPGSLLSWLP